MDQPDPRPGADPAAATKLLSRGLVALALAVGVVLLLTVGSATALTLSHRGEVLPGTTVRGIDVGGLSGPDVQAALAPRADNLQAREVVFVGPEGAEFVVAASEIGYSVDLDATVQSALDAGRTGSLVSRVWASVTAPWSSRTVELAENLDSEALLARVGAVVEAADREVVEGGVTVEGTEVTVTEPVDGFATDRSALTEAVREALGETAPTPRALPGTLTPAGVDPQSVAAAGDLVRRIVSAPMEVADGPTRVSLSARSLGRVVSVVLGEPAAGGLRPAEVVVDDEALQELVDGKTSEVEVAARNATLAPVAPPPVIDTQGDLTFSPQPAGVVVTGEARRGVAVVSEETVAGVRAALLAGEHTAPLVTEVEEPRVTASQAAEVTSLIGTFTTSFTAGQPRSLNIARMADIVDGTVIGPGQRFSLNKVAGKRTPERGFVKDSAIVGGELVDQFGGGVSQFSTTLFNAAFFAGLPIERYKAHSFYISRYPAGREATLDFATIDNVWTNDTDHPVLVHASHTPTTVTVALYGDNGGRVVTSTSGPREVKPESAGGGFVVEVTRTISGGDADGRRTFRTRYVAPPEEP